MPPGLRVQDLRVRYGAVEALRGVSLELPAGELFAIIGPARSGKSTLLSALNRGLELVRGARSDGEVWIGGERAQDLDPTALRRRVGMVLPLPVGLPLSVYDNVALAPRMAGARRGADLDARVERCLREAALWDEVKDRLDLPATRLSGGQQQRLTLARALSTDPEVLCLDEFSIAIDPLTTARIEETLVRLRGRVTVVLVTNLLAQARRLAARTAFLLDGRCVEEGPTAALFEAPRDPRTAAYLAGDFG